MQKTRRVCVSCFLPLSSPPKRNVQCSFSPTWAARWWHFCFFGSYVLVITWIMSQLSEGVFPAFQFSLPLLCCHRNQTVTSSLCPSPAAVWASTGLQDNWWAEGVNVWLWTNKTKKGYSNVIVVQERLCLPEECAHTGEHTGVIHSNSTAAYNKCGQFIFWLGLQICACKCRSASTPRNVVGARMGWQGPSTGEGYCSSSTLSSVLCGKPIHTGKGTFLLFFFVKWRKAPHCPFHSPHSGVLFPHISYKKKYSFHKYVATCRLTPGAEQQAHWARSKHQLGLIKALATTWTVTRNEKNKITTWGFSAYIGGIVLERIKNLSA